MCRLVKDGHYLAVGSFQEANKLGLLFQMYLYVPGLLNPIVASAETYFSVLPMFQLV